MRKRYRLFPFTKDPKLDYIHRNLVACIESPGFHFELPHLPQHLVDRIATNGLEIARLGFVGDAHISSSIAIELRRAYPNSSPHFYTRARTVLVANSTFAHLMKKVGLFKETDPVKPAGDAFEAILAVFHAERGPIEFQSYIRNYFFPLIITVAHAFRNSQTLSTKSRRHLKVHLPRPLAERRTMDKKGKKEASRREKGLVPRRHPLPTTAANTQLPKNGKASVKIPETIDLTRDTDSEDERAVAMLVVPDLQVSSSLSNDMVVDHPTSKLPTRSQPFQMPLRLPIPQRIQHPYSQQGNNWDDPIVLD